MAPLERRGKVLAEIVASEQSYIRLLHVVKSLYIAPIRAAHGTASAVLTPDDEVKMFANLERVCDINEQLLNALVSRNAHTDRNAIVGDCEFLWGIFFSFSVILNFS